MARTIDLTPSWADPEHRARLSAAAPELLAALEALHSCHRGFSNSPDWTALDDDAREIAETAIAKARGEY